MKNIIFVLLLLETFVFSQEYILKINDKPFSKNELEENYKKSFEVFGVDTSLKNVIDKELLIQEAKKLKLEESEFFKNKIQKYKNDNLYNALEVENKKNEIFSEIKSHMDRDLSVFVLSVKIQSPYERKDTLAAFLTLAKLKKGNVKIEKIKKLHNKGKLKQVILDEMIISHLNSPYLVETNAYSIKKEGESSEVFLLDGRANLILLHKILTKKGTYELRQLLIVDSLNVYKSKIDDAYRELTTEKKSFETVLSKYISEPKAQDLLRNSSKISSNNFPLNIQSELEKIKPNQYTIPIKSKVGWHIFQLISFTPIDLSEKAIDLELENKLRSELIHELLKNEIIKKAKKHFAVEINSENFNEFKSIAFESFQSKRGIEIKKVIKKNDLIFSVKNNTIATIADISNQWNKRITNIQIDDSFDSYLKNFLDKMCQLAYIDYAIDHVFEYNKNVSNQYDQYENELLYQEILKQLTAQSREDFESQKKYYNENQNQFILNKRGEGTVYICQDEEMANVVMKALNDEIKLKKIIDTYSGKSSPKQKFYISTYQGEFDLNNKYIPAGTELKTGIQKINFNESVYIIDFKKILPKSIMKFEKAKQFITEQYGVYYIENKANELLKTAKIIYNEPVISQLKQKYTP